MTSQAQRTTSRTHGATGFSLIELLLVVAIILVIAMIAIPNLLRSRISANESSAVQTMRTIVSAEHVYSSQYANGFAPSLLVLGPGGAASCDAADLVDPVLAAGQKGGYVFVYAGVNMLPTAAPGCAAPGFGGFGLQANPISPGVTGQRFFFTDQSGVIRSRLAGAATVLDAPIN